MEPKEQRPARHVRQGGELSQDTGGERVDDEVRGREGGKGRVDVGAEGARRRASRKGMTARANGLGDGDLAFGEEHDRPRASALESSRERAGADGVSEAAAERVQDDGQLPSQPSLTLLSSLSKSA